MVSFVDLNYNSLSDTEKESLKTAIRTTLQTILGTLPSGLSVVLSPGRCLLAVVTLGKGGYAGPSVGDAVLISCTSTFCFFRKYRGDGGWPFHGRCVDGDGVCDQR